MPGPTTLQILRSSVAGRASNTLTLPNAGQLALNMTDQILYSTNGGGAAVIFEIGANVGTQVVRTSLSVGNDSINTTVNSTFINVSSIQAITAAYIGSNVDITTDGLFVGNTEANIIANSTAVLLANSAGTANLAPSLLLFTSVDGSYWGEGEYSAWKSRVFQHNIAANTESSITLDTGTGDAAAMEILSSNSLGTIHAASFYVNTSFAEFLIGNSAVYISANSTALKLANSTVALNLTKPTAAQVTAGNYFLGANNLWQQAGGGSPGGANTNVQFNLSGAIGGSAGFTFNVDTNNAVIANTLTIPNITMTGLFSTNGALGTADQILTSNSTGGPYWAILSGPSHAPGTRIYQAWVANSTVNTTFTVTGGYGLNQIDVYYNGVHLANSEYTQTPPDVILDVPALIDSSIEVIGYNITVASMGMMVALAAGQAWQ